MMGCGKDEAMASKKEQGTLEPDMLDPYAVLKTLMFLEDHHLIQRDTVRMSLALRDLEKIKAGANPLDSHS